MAPECLSAIATGMGPALTTRLMATCTFCAPVILVPGMDAQMTFQAGAALKGLPTVGTQDLGHFGLGHFGLSLWGRRGLQVLGMRQEVMHEAGAPLEAAAALCTQEGGLRGMCEQVLGQMGALAEAVVAEVAGVRALVCVCAHVQFEDGAPTEALSTAQAQEGA